MIFFDLALISLTLSTNPKHYSNCSKANEGEGGWVQKLLNEERRGENAHGSSIRNQVRRGVFLPELRIGYELYGYMPCMWTQTVMVPGKVAGKGKRS